MDAWNIYAFFYNIFDKEKTVGKNWGTRIGGFENSKAPFDTYKIIKNCNCIITVNNQDINIHNKHNAIIFYKDRVPVRLVVINKDTNIDKCIRVSLEQHFENSILKDYYVKHNIKSSIIDMKEEPICKVIDNTKVETDVGSCDRWKLLYNMLKGSYTESSIISISSILFIAKHFLPKSFIEAPK